MIIYVLKQNILEFLFEIVIFVSISEPGQCIGDLTSMNRHQNYRGNKTFSSIYLFLFGGPELIV